MNETFRYNSNETTTPGAEIFEQMDPALLEDQIFAFMARITQLENELRDGALEESVRLQREEDLSATKEQLEIMKSIYDKKMEGQTEPIVPNNSIKIDLTDADVNYNMQDIHDDLDNRSKAA